MRPGLRRLYLDATRTRAVPEADPQASPERYCDAGDLVPDEAVEQLGLIVGVDVAPRDGDAPPKALKPSANKSLSPGADK